MEITPINNNILYASRLLDPREVAEALNVSKGFIYKMVKLGQLPAVRIGASIKISPADLREFMEVNRTVK
jgi:excisionase family DNA binding protein